MLPPEWAGASIARGGALGVGRGLSKASEARLRKEEVRTVHRAERGVITNLVLSFEINKNQLIMN